MSAEVVERPLTYEGERRQPMPDRLLESLSRRFGPDTARAVAELRRDELARRRM